MPSRNDDFCVGCALAGSPGLTKLMWPGYGLLLRSFFRWLSSQSAVSLCTLSCRHLYRPCFSAVEQEDKTCSRVAVSHIKYNSGLWTINDNFSCLDKRIKNVKRIRIHLFILNFMPQTCVETVFKLKLNTIVTKYSDILIFNFAYIIYPLR